MSTYQELLAQRAALQEQQAALEKQLDDARKAERTGVVSQIKALMAEHGITIADLGRKGSAKGKGGTGQKVAPKYRNTATGETWSGRGLQPKWVKAALASGKKLEDLAI